MKFSLAVLWPTNAAIAGMHPGEAIRISDFRADFAGLGLSLKVDVPAELCPERELSFSFERLKDFRPDQLVKTTPYLANIARASEYLAEAGQDGSTPGEILNRLKSWPGLPLDLDGLSLEAGTEQPGEASSSAVDKILDMVAMPRETGRLQGIEAVRAALDDHLGQVLSRVINDPVFQRLESLWRSVHLVFRQSGRDVSLSCSILPVDEDGLEEALGSVVPEFVDDLPDLILFDCPLTSSSADLELFRLLADLGHTLLVPCLCWVGPEFFNLRSWDELSRLPFLPHHLEEPWYAKWRRLVQEEPCKWLGVTCNRFLLRGPVKSEGSGTPGMAESPPLWAGPAWAVAGLMVQSQAEFGWATHFSDWRQVRMEGMETVPDPHGRALVTETAFSDERLHQLSAIRFMPVMGALNHDFVFAPVDACLSGQPFSEQVFASRISQELIQCRESFQGSADPSRVKAGLEEHFAAVFAEHGQVRPDRFEILAQETQSGCRTRIDITPSRIMLPTRRPYAMDLEWS